MEDDYVWLAGWNVTKMHAVEKEKMSDDDDNWIRSMCGAYVRQTPPKELMDWTVKELSKGVLRCKRCERNIKKEMIG